MGSIERSYRKDSSVALYDAVDSFRHFACLRQSLHKYPSTTMQRKFKAASQAERLIKRELLRAS